MSGYGFVKCQVFHIRKQKISPFRGNGMTSLTALYVLTNMTSLSIDVNSLHPMIDNST